MTDDFDSDDEVDQTQHTASVPKPSSQTVSDSDIVDMLHSDSELNVARRTLDDSSGDDVDSALDAETPAQSDHVTTSNSSTPTSRGRSSTPRPEGRQRSVSSHRTKRKLTPSPTTNPLDSKSTKRKRGCSPSTRNTGKHAQFVTRPGSSGKY